MTQQGDPWLIACFEHVGCSHLTSIFVENEIDFETFKGLTRDEVTTILPGKMGLQKKIYAVIESIRAADDAKNNNNGQVLQETPSKLQDCKTEEPKQEEPTKEKDIEEESPSAKPRLKIKPPTPPPKKPGKNSVSSPSPPVGPNTPDSGFFAKYGGAVLPSVGNFATTVALGAAQRVVINEYLVPCLSTSGIVKNAPGVGITTPGDKGAGRDLPTTTTNVNLPVVTPVVTGTNDYDAIKNEIQAKYGDLNKNTPHVVAVATAEKEEEKENEEEDEDEDDEDGDSDGNVGDAVVAVASVIADLF